MIKVVIVDDEVLVRMGIRTTIDWHRYGFDIVGEADNGQKALEVIRETDPDVVLVDIRMPKIDGLTFIKRLKAEYPNIKTVVLSCYNDFEYVREALRLGAIDYIPKLSMQPQDLIKVMESVKDVVEKEKSGKDEVLRLRELVNSNIHDLRSKFFNDIIDFPDSREISQKDIKALQLRLKGDYYVLLLICMDEYRSTKEDLYKTMNLIDGMIREKWNGSVFYKDENKIGLIISFEDISGILPIGDIIKEVKDLSFHLIKELKQQVSISTSIGISNTFKELKGIKDGYKEALSAVESRLYTGKGSVTYYGDVRPYRDISVYDGDKERTLRNALGENRIDDVRKVIYALIEQIRADNNILPSKVKKDAKDILHTFTSVIKELGGNIENIRDKDGNGPEKAIDYCITLDDIETWFDDFIGKCASYINELKRQRYGRDVSNAIDYVHKHYMWDITLKNVVDYVKMNESYFSYLFKKETGKNKEQTVDQYIQNVKKRADDAIKNAAK